MKPALDFRGSVRHNAGMNSRVLSLLSGLFAASLMLPTRMDLPLKPAVRKN
jgi:hypothetical protein